MDANIAATINGALNSVLGTNDTYAGAGATELTNEQISQLMSSVNRLSSIDPSSRTAEDKVALEQQSTALAQIMNFMDTAAKKTNSNISVFTTTQSTYNPAPSSDSGSSGGSNS